MCDDTETHPDQPQPVSARDGACGNLEIGYSSRAGRWASKEGSVSPCRLGGERKKDSATPAYFASSANSDPTGGFKESNSLLPTGGLSESNSEGMKPVPQGINAERQ